MISPQKVRHLRKIKYIHVIVEVSFAFALFRLRR